MNIYQLESFKLSDAVKFHNKLNPKLWDRREHLIPEIKEQLMTIAEDFAQFLGVKNLDIKDVTVSGSNAAYSYTPHSDIDLHLVVEFPQSENYDIFRELVDAKKSIYNKEHDIKIKGIPVELYVQASDEEHHSQGIYSLIQNDWQQIPKRSKADIDDVSVKSKYKDLSKRIREAVKSKNLEHMNAIADKLKNFRSAGLANHGEFGPENLAYKLLRNRGDLEKLFKERAKIKSQELSLKERDVEPVKYGYGTDYIEEVGITPDGTNPTTCQFTNEEIPESKSDEDVVRNFTEFCVQQLGLEKDISLRLRRDPAWSQRNKTFGRYNGMTNELEVAVGNRHIMDILRTLAHELVHQRQHEVMSMPDDAGEDGSEWENEANARAGVLMRRYGKLHPELFAFTSLNESFDSPYRLKWEKGEFGDYDAYTYLPDGSVLSIMFNQEDEDHYTIEFYRNNSQDVTGEGDAQKIFATVLSAIQRFLKTKAQPKYISFTAAKNEARDSRSSLYTALFQRYAQTWGYRLKNIIDGRTAVTFDLVKINQNVAESSGYIPTAAEANDPRYKMALTVDVRPGAIGRAANAFLLDTDSQGHPQVLRPDGKVHRMSNTSRYNLAEEFDLEKELEEGWRSTLAGAATAGALAFGAPTPTAVSTAPQTTTQQAAQPQTSQAPAAKTLQKTAEAYGLKGTELAAFMSQCAHETANFSTLKEFGGKRDFKKYDISFNPSKAKRLGNVNPGDGNRYSGRGFIQLTGRENYRRAGEALNLPLEQHPELVERPDIAAKVAVWYWQNRVQPNVSDFRNVSQVTKHINPGMAGLADRNAKFKEYMLAMNDPTTGKI